MQVALSRGVFFPDRGFRLRAEQQAGLAQSLVESLLLSPGFWCTQGFVCALQKSLFPPALWKLCNQIPLTFKVRFPGDSQFLCQILRLGSLMWSLERSQQCRDFSDIIALHLWVAYPAALWEGYRIFGRANVDLLQEDLCYMACLSGMLMPVLLSLWQATVDPCLFKRPSNTHRQVWLRTTPI